ncbi:MAG: signal transduction histidine kinase, nitrogen specific, NtrB [Bacteroidetes bacterium]|jgi:PAS domain S-box-containing protein|nr:signal transduction histidine kinase, nitrogen specific, NtrB [Bacteroidota bacterium]
MKSSEAIKILLVEDDAGDHFLFKEYLSDIKNYSYSLTWANSYDLGVELVKKREHDIYFFDYLLGAKTGLDLVQQCFSDIIDVPVIILTGLGNQEADMKAMELGVSDYLVKDEIDPEKLERTIRYSIGQSQMLKKLKASETKFRSIFENSHDIIYVSDIDGNLLDINKSAENLFGYSHEELLKMNTADLYDNKEDRLNFVDVINETGICSNFEVTLRDKEGNKKFCTITASIQRRDDDNNVYYQGIIHDMTQRKKAEHDLMIAEKLAITGKIARILAHEVRNPLTNINLSVEQLEEDLKDEYQPYFDIIKRNSKRINDLVTELIENSKPTELKASKSTLQSILQGTIELAKDRANLKNIKIITDFENESIEIDADESKLKIALLNVLMNAIEAVEANAGEIRIAYKCENEKCMISIGDNGCGIKDEYLHKIFDPYFTGKSTGVGLGLATTRSIINMHNGTIEVETQLGKGTVFHIKLNQLIAN